jgi:hypothetical protein
MYKHVSTCVTWKMKEKSQKLKILLNLCINNHWRVAYTKSKMAATALQLKHRTIWEIHLKIIHTYNR